MEPRRALAVRVDAKCRSQWVLCATWFLSRKYNCKYYHCYKRKEHRRSNVYCFPFCHSLGWLKQRRLAGQPPELITAKSADETGSDHDHRNDQYEEMREVS